MSALAVTRSPIVIADHLVGSARKGPSLMARIAIWVRASNSRHRLSELDDRMLADLGLTREQAVQEAARPFWDVTAGARR